MQNISKMGNEKNGHLKFGETVSLTPLEILLTLFSKTIEEG